MSKYREKDHFWSKFYFIGAFCDERLVEEAKKELKSQLNSGILGLTARRSVCVWRAII
jgi:hypothetical protein